MTEREAPSSTLHLSQPCGISTRTLGAVILPQLPKGRTASPAGAVTLQVLAQTLNPIAIHTLLLFAETEAHVPPKHLAKRARVDI